MSADVSAITGPARCGKTERLLVRYRQELALFRPGSAVWLAPTQRSAAAIRGRLLTADLRACLDPGVMTFDQFATAILAASPQPVQQIDSVQQRDIFRRLVDQLVERGELKHFQPIAHTSGLIDLLAQFVRELKRLEIWPDEFLAACERRSAGNKDRELWRLYSQYQELLTRRNLFDAEGRFWSARALLRQRQPARFAELNLVVVDGFTDFTRTQHEMLEILAERVGELAISLPLEPPPAREELFAKTLATFGRLQQRHPGLRHEPLARPPAPPWPSMAHLETELFQNPRQHKPAPEIERIEIIAAASPLGEMETLARRIKTLLIDGDPQTGAAVRPGDVAVVFRSPRDYVVLVREVFDRFGLPTAIEIGRRLDESKAITAMVALVQLQLDDWPYRQLLALLRNNFFRPDWPEATAEAIDAAEETIRQLQVPVGQKVLLDRIGRWARLDALARGEEVKGRDPRWPEQLAERRRLAALAMPLLQRLGQALAVLTDNKEGFAPAEFSTALDQLAEETGLRRSLFAAGSESPLAAQEPAAWRRWMDALSNCQNLAGLLGEPPQRLLAADWLSFLQDVAQAEQLPGSHEEAGRVRVLAAASARALDIPYLFFAGLAEKSFPPAARDDGLYSEAETSLLVREGGLPLVLRAERNQEEMLLFYEVLTRASRWLFLSYPALDSKAQELLPSPYLREIERVCGQGRIRQDRAADLSPLPPRGEPLSEIDYRVLAVADAFDKKDDLLAAYCSLGLENTTRPKAKAAASCKTRDLASSALEQDSPIPAASRAVFAGLRVTAARANRQQFGPFEGLFESDVARQRLEQSFGPEKLWSASHLEMYATCPFRFFMKNVLGVEPLEELGLATDYMARGGLLHELLASLHRRVNAARGGKPTSPMGLAREEFSGHLEEALSALMSLADNDDALAAALREIDLRMIRLWTQHYRVQHDDYAQLWEECDTAPLPAHFEISFGLDPLGDDPRSSPSPLLLDCGDEVVKVAGRIDRVDVGNVAGRAVFNVLDYKSGKTRAKAQAEIDGQALQLELYSLAVEQVLLKSDEALPWHAGYWHPQHKKAFATYVDFHEKQEGGVRPTAAWQARLQLLLEKVRELVRGIRAGAFPVHSLDKDCTGQCPYSTVCRINQVRSLEKTWPPAPPSPA